MSSVFIYYITMWFCSNAWPQHFIKHPHAQQKISRITYFILLGYFHINVTRAYERVQYLYLKGVNMLAGTLPSNGLVFLFFALGRFLCTSIIGKA